MFHAIPLLASLLTVAVSPPRDPAGQPWSVQLLEEEQDGKLKVVADGPAQADGIWRRERLEKGVPYRLRVKTAENEGWWMDEKPFTATGPELRREIALASVNVHGTVRFGKRLLRDATVVFGGEGAKVSVRFQADEHGRFQGPVPREGWWKVQVSSEAPRVNKIVEVEVEPETKEGYTEVEVAVASFAIEGKVVDENGAPVSDRGHLNVTKLAYPPDFFQKRIPEDISPFFRFDALNVGEYRLQFSAHKSESEIVSVMVGDDGTTDPPYLVLVSRPRNLIRGRVVAPNDEPIARVGVMKVNLIGEDEPIHYWNWPNTSGADGRFTIEVNGLKKEVCLALKKRPLGLRLVRVIVSPDEETFTMDARQGTIRLEGIGWLEHAGCSVLPSALWGQRSEAHFMEPGSYRFCRRDPPDCVDGELLPGGTLTLTIDEKKR